MNRIFVPRSTQTVGGGFTFLKCGRHIIHKVVNPSKARNHYLHQFSSIKAEIKSTSHPGVGRPVESETRNPSNPRIKSCFESYQVGGIPKREGNATYHSSQITYL